MKVWNRLPQASLLTRCHDTFSLPQGGFSRTMSSNVANKFKLKRKCLQSYLWLCQETKWDVLADLRGYHLTRTRRRLALSISRDRQASRSVYVNWRLNLYFLKRVLKTKELFPLYIFLDVVSNFMLMQCPRFSQESDRGNVAKGSRGSSQKQRALLSSTGWKRPGWIWTSFNVSWVFKRVIKDKEQ